MSWYFFFSFIPPSYLASPNNTYQTLYAMLTTHSYTCHSALMNLLVLKVHLLRCLTAFEILELDRLQRVKNIASRIIFFLPKLCHITLVLVRLHWLPIKSRIHFKICLITFKVLHGLSPSYLFDLISVKKTRYILRSLQAPVLNRPRTNRRTIGDSSFAAAAPTLWNALPQEIRQCQNINVFKCLLKTHLFRLAYNV